jgi:DUF1009 family protein
MSEGSDRSAPIGMIAGQGRLPLELARAARRSGRRVVATALRGFAEASFETEVDACAWVHVGQVAEVIRVLKQAGVREAVLAGLVPKETLFADRDLLRLDERGRALLADLGHWGDDAILRAVADVLESEGIRMRAQGELAPDLLVGEGPLGAVAPSAEQLDEVAYAWPIVKAVGRLDIGQTLVVRGRSVLAVEAIEGTDAAIRRGGAFGHGPLCVLKVRKPNQDPRFDAPTIGPGTIESLRSAGGGILAAEAGCTIAVERERLIREADAAGICVVGVRDPAEAVGGGR